jgi:hypothetical protein
MSEMLEMVSLTTLDPVCFEKLDPDDVRPYVCSGVMFGLIILFRFCEFGTIVKIATTTRTWGAEVEVEVVAREDKVKRHRMALKLVSQFQQMTGLAILRREVCGMVVKDLQVA